MAPAKAKQKEGGGERVSIINAVKTPLGFFVLVVLVVEGALGGLAAKGPNQLTALYGMFGFLAALIAVVAFFAVRYPEALLGRRANEQGLAELRKFCDRISGYWWESIQPAEPTALSLVEISRDPITETVKMKAHAYNSKGEVAAFWESVAVCIKPTEGKVFYYWKGWHPLRPSEPFEGFGEISFNESLNNAVGVFSDTNLTDWKTTIRKSATLQRSSDQEVQVLKTRDDKLTSGLVRSKLSLAS
jgi:hypothetical protein